MDIKLSNKIQVSIEIPELNKLPIVTPFLDQPKKAKNGQVIRLSKDIPNKSGVYFLFGSDGNVLYIGKAVDIRSRISKHTKQRSISDIRDRRGFSYKLVTHVSWLLVENEGERDIVETAYLNIIPTAFNCDKVGKSELMLKTPEDPELLETSVQEKIIELAHMRREYVEQAWSNDKTISIK